MTTMGHGIIHFDTLPCVKMDNFLHFFDQIGTTNHVFFYLCDESQSYSISG